MLASALSSLDNMDNKFLEDMDDCFRLVAVDKRNIFNMYSLLVGQ